jgi:hypothetical protein
MHMNVRIGMMPPTFDFSPTRPLFSALFHLNAKLEAENAIALCLRQSKTFRFCRDAISSVSGQTKKGLRKN